MQGTRTGGMSGDGMSMLESNGVGQRLQYDFSIALRHEPDFVIIT
jgi:hypothetical protein